MTIYKGTVPIAGLAKNTIVNGFHIFDCKWADHLLEDISWLRADTFSWQSGSVYVTAYNELVSEYNNASSTTETEGSITFKRTPKGYKIADATQETAILNKYNTDGIAWYYILDTANTQFKLPRTKFGFEGLRGNVGDDIAESLPNIKGSLSNAGMSGYTGYTNLEGSGAFTGESVSGWYSKENGGGRTTATGTLNFSASNSSSTYQNNAPVQERATQMYLYFYVGEYAQTAIEQTAGLNAELFNGKVDINLGNFPKPYLKTCYVNGTSGYNIWSNGYCEQWGRTTMNAVAPITVTFAKNFKDINYNSFSSIGGVGSVNNNSYIIATLGKTVSGMNIENYNSGTGNNNWYEWRACGYLASGQY